MRARQAESIAFPANPFVAIADFMVLLVILMVLAVVHQSISSSNLLTRAAVGALQKHLVSQLNKSNDFSSAPALRRAFQLHLIRNTRTDGDLQRFWFDGTLLFEFGSAQIKPEGRNALAAFGRILSRYQGSRNSRGNGLFKYVLVEGHADPSEGDDQTVRNLSFARANEAVQILHTGDSTSTANSATPPSLGLAPVLMKAVGRGSLDANEFTFSPEEMRKLSKWDRVLRNKRIEIVVVYSGDRALDYYQRLKSASTVPLQSNAQSNP